MGSITNIVMATGKDGMTNGTADRGHMTCNDVEEMGRLLSESLLMFDFHQKRNMVALKV